MKKSSPSPFNSPWADKFKNNNVGSRIDDYEDNNVPKNNSSNIENTLKEKD